MGTFLKYAFYIALILIVYLIGKGIYDGSINETSTVEDVANNVENEAKNMAKNASNAIEKTIDDYEKHPKKEIDLD